MSLTVPITFSEGGSALDRAQHLRSRAKALLHDPQALVLPMAGGKLLIDLSAGEPALCWRKAGDAGLPDPEAVPVFLGLVDGAPRFAADIPVDDGDGPDPRFPETSKFIDLRSVAGQLTAAEATVAAAAKAIIGWHESHGHCARCGSASEVDEGGWRRRCPECRALHFPRTDPVVIMLVLHRDRVLLGRQASWGPGIYSLLAGFMEPGETIEDAVRREVMEETQVRVGPVRYLACQPWPFPSNLMLGCVGEAETTEITIDPTEIEDALWVSRSDMADVLAGRHERIAPPRLDAIARALLIAWVKGEVDGV